MRNDELLELVIKALPYPTLTQEAEEVTVHEEVRVLIDEMWKVMIKENGCGIAANQVGVLKRVIIVSTPGFTGEIINPVLSNGRFEKNSKEGCLSVPGVKVTKKRFNRITVTGQDRNGKFFSKNLKALSAFCVQHEVDHLNGITIAV
jgi:peptide deformylase